VVHIPTKVEYNVPTPQLNKNKKVAKKEKEKVAAPTAELQGGPDAKEPHNNGLSNPARDSIEFKTDCVIDC